jgi:hypothetical protein
MLGAASAAYAGRSAPARRSVKSTLLGGLRSPPSCGNAGLHSGGHKIHGKGCAPRWTLL